MDSCAESWREKYYSKMTSIKLRSPWSDHKNCKWIIKYDFVIEKSWRKNEKGKETNNEADLFKNIRFIQSLDFFSQIYVYEQVSRNINNLHKIIAFYTTVQKYHFHTDNLCRSCTHGCVIRIEENAPGDNLKETRSRLLNKYTYYYIIYDRVSEQANMYFITFFSLWYRTAVLHRRVTKIYNFHLFLSS